ncbi:Transposase, Synechocystis PCC 6803 domain and Lambda repressor-like, DNA-binding domain-containing protein [Strongyloides ratti]|uniref:Transposase, Synechocystis PCC 6803 domain and Lambda repressor-like, DNA-binding domain-containing protein n=1 Tax=Strongyloides ratti TaxID=34506 RepID=A0A090KS57_STRRB|nr:Transposase, Synechocystis PCC 6803 domain and Lambda repressor-like, DNA-binding domain-containing protein [Strongyloides ratti]CEF60350.1 Transposase, Synechocystis PCC 6803 domain and Lambda repressor-like, DNA-binding domain-containing protein [Strongyloides ratti]
MTKKNFFFINFYNAVFKRYSHYISLKVQKRDQSNKNASKYQCCFWREFGESNDSTTLVHKIQKENESLENENCKRSAPTVNNDELKNVIEANSCQAVREVSKVMGVSKSSVSRHLRQIGRSIDTL